MNDQKQPKYIKGWVKNEIRRLDQIKAAKKRGVRTSGRNKRHVRGIPGFDVGHRYPGVDKSSNFRLEMASVNRARYHVAKRMGLSSKYR